MKSLFLKSLYEIPLKSPSMSLYDVYEISLKFLHEVFMKSLSEASQNCPSWIWGTFFRSLVAWPPWRSNSFVLYVYLLSLLTLLTNSVCSAVAKVPL